MKLSYYNKLSIKIIGLTLTMMLYSFIPDYLHVFFGDYMCLGSGEYLKEYHRYALCNATWFDRIYHLPEYHWGYRHILFNLCGIALTILQLINIFNTENN